MSYKRQETIADIVAEMHYCAEKNSAWCCTTVEFETFADRIFAAHKREMADEKRISDAVIQSLRDKKLEMAGELAAKDAEIARLRALVARAREVTETISQPHRGARMIAETTEAKDPTHSAVRKG